MNFLNATVKYCQYTHQPKWKNIRSTTEAKNNKERNGFEGEEREERLKSLDIEEGIERKKKVRE